MWKIRKEKKDEAKVKYREQSKQLSTGDKDRIVATGI